MNRYRILTGTAVTLLLAGCASVTKPKTPDFYPNEKYQQVGHAQAEAAAQYCMALADEYVRQPDKFNDSVKQGVTGAVIGSGTGAIGGAIMGGSVGRAVGAGAAIGGVLGVLKSLSETNQHSPSYERFVEHCLQKQGFEVIGWSH